VNKKFNEKQILIASNNHDKIREISLLFNPFGVEVIPASKFNIVEPEETEETFAGNSLLKARYYGKATGLPALADDSGISIDELDGFPGVISARIAGENKDFKEAFSLIEDRLKQKKIYTSKASMTCSLSLYWPNEEFIQVEGKVIGNIVFDDKLRNGFGYDPIFIADGETETFAQMSQENKNKISHRSIAIKKLIDICF
jgi:XTP/dITP diphosphohydrolase